MTGKSLANSNGSTAGTGAARPTSLGHMPGGAWKFDESVSAVFDDMLARSIPNIALMRDLVFRLACRFVQPDTHVLDLGSSRGEAIAPLVERFGSGNRFLGIEASEPMLKACRDRFGAQIADGIVEIRSADLRDGYPDVRASVTLSILTLMFTPIEHRFRILADVFRHTVPGGAFILVEKVLGSDAKIDALLVDIYHEHKRAMGYTQEEIDRKRLSLEGVLVPVTAEWNEQALKRAGFDHIECVWRCMNFSGWLAIKA